MVAAAAAAHDFGGYDSVGPPSFDPKRLIGTRSRQPYPLGRQIGAGGNGTVHTIVRRPELVAKVARYPLDRHDASKLELLVGSATPDLLSVAAWPTDCLTTERGQIVGFVMPRILDARPLHDLYSPRGRIQHFPYADYRFVVHAAANVARLFAIVHQSGFLCGDVNHANVMVKPDGTVAAVDCDSFQVGDGSQFPCLVGTQLFVPPELDGFEFANTPRTANHDNFGLAVLLFHMLFMGRHPFAGRFMGRGEMPIERAIADCRFAYSRDRRRTQMEPPPLTLPLEGVGPAAAELFERAFHPNGQRDGARPAPEAWVDALTSLKTSLVPCKDVEWHHHAPSLKRCPWCDIEGAAGIKLFGGLVKAPTAAVADLNAIWMHYQSLLARIANPVEVRWPTPTIPTVRSKSVWERLRKGALIYTVGLGFAFQDLLDGPLWQNVVSGIGQLATTVRDALGVVGLGYATGMIALFLAALGSVIGTPAKKLWRAMKWCVIETDVAAQQRADLLASYKAATAMIRPVPEPKPGLDAYRDLMQPIEALKAELDGLHGEREDELRKHAIPVPEPEQRTRFLATFRIEDAKLQNIGAARCAVLRSWGIDTAADIDAARIGEIPGFGMQLTQRLMAWRAEKETGFVPNITPVVDPAFAQQLDRKLAARRTKLVKRMRELIAEMEGRVAAASG